MPESGCVLKVIRGFPDGDPMPRSRVTLPPGPAAPGVVPGSPPAVVIGINFRTLQPSLRSFTFWGLSSPAPHFPPSLELPGTLGRWGLPPRHPLGLRKRIGFPTGARGARLPGASPNLVYESRRWLCRFRAPAGTGRGLWSPPPPRGFRLGHFASGAPLSPFRAEPGLQGSPPPTRRSRAPPSGRRAPSLRPRLVGGAAHVTALRACGRCRFPQSPSEREETRWRLKAIRSGAPAIRTEPSPSTRFRRPGPSRPAPQASPPGPGAPHRPLRPPLPPPLSLLPPPRLRHEGPAGQAAQAARGSRCGALRPSPATATATAAHVRTHRGAPLAAPRQQPGQVGRRPG